MERGPSWPWSRSGKAHEKTDPPTTRKHGPETKPWKRHRVWGAWGSLLPNTAESDPPVVYRALAPEKSGSGRAGITQRRERERNNRYQNRRGRAEQPTACTHRPHPIPSARSPPASHGTLSAAGTAAVRKIRDWLRKTNSELKKKPLKKSLQLLVAKPRFSEPHLAPSGVSKPRSELRVQIKGRRNQSDPNNTRKRVFANKQSEPELTSGNGRGRNALQFRKVGICWWAVRGRNAGDVRQANKLAR